VPTERFFDSLKNERLSGTRYIMRQEVISDLFDCIAGFHNQSHRDSKLGYHSPLYLPQDWITFPACAETTGLMPLPLKTKNSGNLNIPAGHFFPFIAEAISIERGSSVLPLLL